MASSCTELNGVAPATCKERGSQPQAEQTLFSMNAIKWESVMEKPWKHWQRGGVVGVDL